jgi:hypothetical protein
MNPKMKTIGLALLLCAVAPFMRADCRCPAEASSRQVLVSVGESESTGFVACGHADSKYKGGVVASELQIFSCASGTLIFEFDATQTVRLEAHGEMLHVLELSRWPFQLAWKWVDVPVFEWELQDGTDVTRQVVLAKPSVTNSEIRAAVAEYKRLLSESKAGTAYAADEEIVGRLFTAAIAGDRDAAELFLKMRSEAGLDGAAGEVYEEAFAIYDAWLADRSDHGRRHGHE